MERIAKLILNSHINSLRRLQNTTTVAKYYSRVSETHCFPGEVHGKSPQIANYYGDSRLLRRSFFSTAGSFGKEWFSKRVVLADVPPERKPERGYIRMFPRNKNRNEGTFACSPGTKNRNEATFAKTTLLRNRPFVSVRSKQSDYHCFSWISLKMPLDRPLANGLSCFCRCVHSKISYFCLISVLKRKMKSQRGAKMIKNAPNSGTICFCHFCCKTGQRTPNITKRVIPQKMVLEDLGCERVNFGQNNTKFHRFGLSPLP